MDGYTEGKIEKFGPKFIDVIKNYAPTKRTALHNVLSKHQLKCNIPLISWPILRSFFEEGRTVKEIAALR